MPGPAELMMGPSPMGKRGEGRSLREVGDAELAGARWIAQLRSAPDPSPGMSPVEALGGPLGGAVFGRRTLLQHGRPLKGQETEGQEAGQAGETGVAAPGGSNGAWVDLAEGEGSFQDYAAVEVLLKEKPAAKKRSSHLGRCLDNGNRGGAFAGACAVHFDKAPSSVPALVRGLPWQAHYCWLCGEHVEEIAAAWCMMKLEA